MSIYLQLCVQRQSKDTSSVCGVLQSEAPVSSVSMRRSWVMHGVVAVKFRR